MITRYFSISAFILFSGGLFAQGGCANLYPVVSPDGASLYFSSDRHGSNYEIYRSDLDGMTGLMQLTDSPGDKFFPMLSPDGSKVVYQNGGYGPSAEVFIMNSDGSDNTQLTNNGIHDGNPSFSPDGGTIVFDAWDGSDYPEVFTMNLDGTGRTQITNQSGAYWQSAPKFSPAGDKIYFLAGFNADNHIVRMDLDGSNWVDITPPNNFGYAEAFITFNPAGDGLLFFSTEYQGYNNGGDLITTDLDGGNWERLTNSTPGEYFYSGWYHPTNGTIFYTYLPAGGGSEIWRMEDDGSNMVSLNNCFNVGVSEVLDAAALGLYPNPAADLLTVDLTTFDGAVRVEVLDVQGRVLLTERISSRALGTIDVSGLSSGTYLLRAEGTTGLATRRFTKE